MNLTGAIILVIIAVVAALINYLANGRKRLRRKTVKIPFPDSWKLILKKKIAFYNFLTEDEKTNFENRIQFFIADTTITGLNIKMTDELKLLVASSAIIPVFAHPDWEYRRLNEVFVVDGSVDPEDNKENLVSGSVKILKNGKVMVLSKQALEQGFKNMSDKSNVGIHEFAHILDGSDGFIDGIPEALLPEELRHPWMELMYAEIDRIKQQKSDIEPYGATNEAEFFAVVTEYFFERPKQFRKNHPELYKILSQAFNHDLANSLKVKFSELLSTRKSIQRNDPCPCGSGIKYKHCCLKKN